MSRESEWVEKVRTDIEHVLKNKGLTVQTAYRLPYSFQIAGYRTAPGEQIGTRPLPEEEPHRYQTDLIIGEHLHQTSIWIPRVVVEFKLGKVSTHDALTYSAKAATHKNVHPYLRYGVVIGEYEGPVPKRLMRHGSHFDFMMTLMPAESTARDHYHRLVKLLEEEVAASRTLSKLLSEKSTAWLLHRKLLTGER